MPGAPASAKLGDARSLSKGGTSAVPSGTPMPLIVGVVCVLVAIVVVIVVLMRGGGDDGANTTGPSPSGEVAGKGVEDVEGTDTDTAGDDDDDDQLSPSRASQESQVKADAIKTFAEQLKNDRLWSDVSADRVDENLVVVRTQYCESEELRAVVNAASSALRGAGFSKLACFEQFGALVFEQGL